MGVTATVGVETEDTKVPPHEPEYQYQLAPVDKIPPFIVIVEVDPAQIVFGEDEADEAAVEFDPRTTVVLTQVVIGQTDPSARAKYTVVTVGQTLGLTPDIR